MTVRARGDRPPRCLALEARGQVLNPHCPQPVNALFLSWKVKNL